MAGPKITDSELDRLLTASSPYPRETREGLSVRAEEDLRRILGGGSVPPARSRTRPRRAPAWVAPVIAVGAVAVVAVAVPTLGGLGTPVPPVTSGTPTPTPPTQLDPPDGVDGAGTFVSPDGSTSGRVEVHFDQESITVVVTDLVTTHDELTAVGVLSPRELDLCVDDVGGVEFGAFDTVDRRFTWLIYSDFLHDDWTALDEIDLVASARGAHGECVTTIVARATLEWSTPSLRPWLADLDDRGSRPGATGSVVFDEGRPVAYGVAVNDDIETVAARFGITVGDLRYLNEDPSGEGSLPFEGVLNLDLARR